MMMILVAVLAFVMIAGLGFVFAGGDSGSARAAKRAQIIVSGGGGENRVHASQAWAQEPTSRRRRPLGARD